jgi:HAE1 family hydrophobic/amphiphilic exporter-1
VSLTLTPMLCARVLKPVDHEKKPGRFMRASESVFEWALDAYKRSLDFVLRHRPATLVATFATLFIVIGLYAWVPKGFFPIEDTGFISSTIEAATDTSFEEMAERQRAVSELVRKDKDVAYAVSIAGATGTSRTTNTGRLFISLKPRHERTESSNQIIQRLRGTVSQIPGVKAFFQPVQNISVGGTVSRALYQYTLQSSDTDALFSLAPQLMEKISELQILRDVNSDLQITNPQLTIDVDREKARALGIGDDQIRSVLYSQYGSRQVATLYTANNQFQVIVEAQRRFQRDETDLSRTYLRASTGQLVPLDAIATMRRTVGPLQIAHQQQQPAVTISFNLAPGVSLSEAVAAIQRVEREFNLPILVIYVVLGILYESFIHPLTILVRPAVGRHRRAPDAAAVQDGICRSSPSSAS